MSQYQNIKTVAFEVVDSLPMTDLFLGRTVYFNNQNLIWNGSAWVTSRVDGLPPVNDITQSLFLMTNGVEAAWSQPYEPYNLPPQYNYQFFCLAPNYDYFTDWAPVYPTAVLGQYPWMSLTFETGMLQWAITNAMPQNHLDGMFLGSDTGYLKWMHIWGPQDPLPGQYATYSIFAGRVTVDYPLPPTAPNISGRYLGINDFYLADWVPIPSLPPMGPDTEGEVLWSTGVYTNPYWAPFQAGLFIARGNEIASLRSQVQSLTDKLMGF
jgi:hypothetical protein